MYKLFSLSTYLLKIPDLHDLPSVPLKLMNTRRLSKKDKDKIKKKQEKLDKCLKILGINQSEFLALLRDDPSKVSRL